MYDVLVCGSGPAGLCAAVSAARSGARTLLVERLGFAGGTSTAALVYPWMTFHDPEGRQTVFGLAQEIVDRLVARGASPGHLRDSIGFVHSLTPFDSEALRILADEMLREAGCHVSYHTEVTGADASEAGVRGVTVTARGETHTVTARAFVDATGDAALCHALGLPMQTDVTGRSVQPMSMCFRVGGVDLGAVERYVVQNPGEFHPTTLVGHQPLTGVSGFFTIWRDAALPIPRDRLLFFAGVRPGKVCVNTSRILNRDGTDPADLSEAEFEGRRQVQLLVSFLRDRVPGFSDAFLAALPTQVGVRETRRILGEVTLTADHVIAGQRFPDAIARSAYPVDIHSPTGSGLAYSAAPAAPYDIPFRALVPRGMPNLLVAGRCISATHEGHASTRLTPTCMAMGEAAGRAASWIARTGGKALDWAETGEPAALAGGK